MPLTVQPWESWYFGRGAKPGGKNPFKWTYHFSFGTAQFAEAYLVMWRLVRSNNKGRSHVAQLEYRT